MKRSELKQINQELDYLESAISDNQTQFAEFDQDHVISDLEKIIEKLEMVYKQRTAEKIIQLF